VSTGFPQTLKPGNVRDFKAFKNYNGNYILFSNEFNVWGQHFFFLPEMNTSSMHEIDQK